MQGDIVRSIRINPRTQLAIDNLLKRHDFKGLTINKLISKVLINLDSKEAIDLQELKLINEARGKRVRYLEKKIKNNAHQIWGKMTKTEKEYFDNDIITYIGEQYGVW